MQPFSYAKILGKNSGLLTKFATHFEKEDILNATPMRKMQQVL